MMAAAVAIAIPCQDRLHTAFVKALVKVQGPTFVSFITEMSTVPAKRNYAVRGVLNHPACSHLLMLDSDMVPPADLIGRLLRHGKDIIGALYAQKTPPMRLMAGWHTTPEGAPTDRRVTPHTGPKRVHWVGAGALLVSRSALERVGAPWFAGLAEGDGGGEEVHFQRRGAVLGIETWCDTDLIVPHLCVVGVTPDNASTLEGLESIFTKENRTW